MAESQGHAHPNYLAVFGFLVVLTAASFFTVFLHSTLGLMGIIAFVMGVAVCKATLVAMYFMHLKFERAWKYLMLIPTMVLAVALVLALVPDVGYRDHPELSFPQSEANLGNEAP